MARSYSSYGSGFAPKSGAAQPFEGPVITGGAQGNVGAAADVVNMGNSYGSLRSGAPNFSDISATAIGVRTQERAQDYLIQGQLEATKIGNKAAEKAAKLQAKAAKDAARSSANGSKWGSAFSAIGSIGGALLMSDRTTKENIENIEDALSTLRQLKPVTYNYKEEFTTEYNRVHHGFIAQEYKQVLPDATYNDESINKMCIDTGDLISLLVRSVQQLETKVTRLEAANALAGVK